MISRSSLSLKWSLAAALVVVAGLSGRAHAQIPCAREDCFRTQIGVTLSSASSYAAGVLANDIAVGGITSLAVISPYVGTNATTFGGTILLNPNGSFVYTPPSPGFSGDDTFFYAAADTLGISNIATVTVRVTNATLPSMQLSAMIRDFQFSHPDFESYLGGVATGLVGTTIGVDRKPILVSTGAGTPQGQQITSAASFNQWYRSAPGVNIQIPVALDLVEIAGQNGLYRFTGANGASPTSFFPIDGMGWGNEGNDGGMPPIPHNYGFTLELKTLFVYRPGQIFELFNSDDDLWIYINDQLVVDIGGVHAPASYYLDLDAIAGSIGLVDGGVYSFDLFYAERRTVMSNLEFNTSIEFLTCPVALGCVPADANCDGAVNYSDVSAFATSLLIGYGCSPCAADMNNDGVRNGFDVYGFTVALLAGTFPSCP